jgi:hypothetical protein
MLWRRSLRRLLSHNKYSITSKLMMELVLLVRCDRFLSHFSISTLLGEHDFGAVCGFLQ